MFARWNRQLSIRDVFNYASPNSESTAPSLSAFALAFRADTNQYKKLPKGLLHALVRREILALAFFQAVSERKTAISAKEQAPMSKLVAQVLFPEFYFSSLTEDEAFRNQKFAGLKISDEDLEVQVKLARDLVNQAKGDLALILGLGKAAADCLDYMEGDENIFHIIGRQHPHPVEAALAVLKTIENGGHDLDKSKVDECLTVFSTKKGVTPASFYSCIESRQIDARKVLNDVSEGRSDRVERNIKLFGTYTLFTISDKKGEPLYPGVAAASTPS